MKHINAIEIFAIIIVITLIYSNSYSQLSNETGQQKIVLKTLDDDLAAILNKDFKKFLYRDVALSNKDWKYIINIFNDPVVIKANNLSKNVIIDALRIVQKLDNLILTIYLRSGEVKEIILHLSNGKRPTFITGDYILPDAQLIKLEKILKRKQYKLQLNPITLMLPDLSDTSANIGIEGWMNISGGSQATVYEELLKLTKIGRLIIDSSISKTGMQLYDFGITDNQDRLANYILYLFNPKYGRGHAFSEYLNAQNLNIGFETRPTLHELAQIALQSNLTLSLSFDPFSTDIWHLGKAMLYIGNSEVEPRIILRSWALFY